MAEKTEQQLIEDYRRVEAFLADDAVKDAFRVVKDAVFAKFEAAQTSTQAEDAWMLSRALGEISTELVRTMAKGQFALKVRTEREQKEERMRAARPSTKR